MRILAAADRHQFLDRLHRTIMAVFFPMSTVAGTPIREPEHFCAGTNGGENLAITAHRTNRGPRQKPA